MDAVEFNDSLWFVAPDWLMLVNMAVTALGSPAIVSSSGLGDHFGWRGHRAGCQDRSLDPVLIHCRGSLWG